MFSPSQKKFLSDLGRSTTGQQLLEILETMKTHYSSIQTIDKTRPTDSQIEGRQILNEGIEELAGCIRLQKHVVNPLKRDDFE